ncbi:MAG: hydrolase 1, exosortase A system-associated [Chromatiales bacterium]|jgi:exosortase A-associated hydrolase 1
MTSGASDRGETPVQFECGSSLLLGIVHQGAPGAKLGVLVVVGGPQTRVGSHRQFVLLARHLAGGGVPTMRFDYRGMGDSEGKPRTFETVGEDIRAALDAFALACPSLERFAIWGLCDAASAAAFYAAADPRVAGIALLNPWVRTERGQASAFVRDYYPRRLFSFSLWRKVLRREFRAAVSFGAFVDNLLRAGAPRIRRAGTSREGPGGCPWPEEGSSLPGKVLDALERFDGAVLLVLSGRDLTASEFKGVVRGSPAWRRLLAADRVTRRELEEADHTFSNATWRDQVERWTLDWLRRL